MVQPINYTAYMTQLDPRSFTELGQSIGQINQQRIAAKKAEQYRQDIERTFKSGRPEDFAALIAKYPQQREAFKDSWGILDKSQQDTEFRDAAQVYNALQTNPDIAKQLLDGRIIATQNAGEDATDLEQIRALMDSNPDAVKNQLAFTLSSIDPDKWVTISSEMRDRNLAPEELSIAQSKARKAAVDANFAESEAVIDLQKKGWDIFKIQEDIKIAKENNRIAAMNAQLARETNEIKRRQLEQKIAEAERKREQELRDRVASVESANTNIDNMLNTADRILQTPIGVVEDATGPIQSRLLTVDEDTANFEALIENLDAQAFLSQVPNLKGLGALSDAEGKKLTAALQNFNLKQGAPRLLDNIREAQRLLLKARSNIARRYGVPQTIPDTPAVEVSPEDIEALLQKYGGQ